MTDRGPAVRASSTCRAPHVALRFSPDGEVHACCVNDQYPLGRVGRQSLREIWEGRPLGALREALDQADYSLGCQDCELDHRLGERLHTHAEQFDRYPQPEGALEWPKRVEFALSNTCNLQCVQCNGDLSSSIRSQREHRPALVSPYGDAFFEQLGDLLSHLEVAVFIGGEPFLARECRRVWDLLIERELCPEVHVTTNATVWDDRVEHYVHALRMNVAVSVDGVDATVNEAIRRGSRFAEVVANRDRFLAATRATGRGFILNHCLMRENWHQLGEFLMEADRLDVDVHVIPVHYPAASSIFGLPADERQAIVDALDASPVAARLGRNRPVWQGIVEHVRAQHEASTRGVAVSLGGRGEQALVERWRRELSAWSGQGVVALRAPQGVLREAEVPDWARPLGVEDHLGATLEDFTAAMSGALGPRLDLRARVMADGCTWLTYRHELAGGSVSFRTVVVPRWGVLTATRAASLPLAPGADTLVG